MQRFRPRFGGVAAVLIIVGILVSLAACQSVPLTEHQETLAAVDQLQTQLESTREQLSQRDERISTLEADVAALQSRLTQSESDTSAAKDDLDVALQQLGSLRENRLDLQEQLDAQQAELDRLRTTAIAAQRAEEATAAAASTTDIAAPNAMAAALAGGGGFTRVDHLGFRNDPRAAARLAAAAPGVGVDTDTATPILYDSRVDYAQTGVYLAIIDPEGRRPRLQLTAQYATDIEPIYLRTAFITIEGGDPVDPIDPIVLAGEPARQTDGASLREALSMNADNDLIERLSTMISSSRFRVTFVGMTDQYTHRPSVAERAAMSNMLFAFIDLGGVR